jgi:hypothetical protein
MSVPDHQIDPPDRQFSFVDESGEVTHPPDSYVTKEEVEGYWAVDQEIKVVFPVDEAIKELLRQKELRLNEIMMESVVPMLPTTPITIGIDPGNSDEVVYALLPECGHVFPFMEPLQLYSAYDHTTLTDQIMEIFDTYWPVEEDADRWWPIEPIFLDCILSSHEKRTRYYLEKYPWWKLWKINKKLQEEKLSPTIDHEESQIMIGKSKASAAYIQHNDNFKRFIEELCPV